MHKLLVFATFGFGTALVGCGGSSGPAPLKYSMDDMYLATVPIEDKQEVLQAQQAYSVAKMERASVEAKYQEAGHRLDVAKNQEKQARLDMKNAESKKQAAEDTGDMNKINARSAELHGAELARQAAQAKVEWVKENKKYLKEELRYRTEEMYHQEARYELAKAQVAQQKNIRPKGFDFASYQAQVQERSRRAQKWRARAEQAKTKAENKKKQWEALQAQADNATRAASGS